VFSELQRKVLMPNDFASPRHVERRILTFFAERNRTAPTDSLELYLATTHSKDRSPPSVGRILKTRNEFMIRCT